MELEINKIKSILKSKGKEKIGIEMAIHLSKTFHSDWKALSGSEVSNLLLAGNLSASLLLSVAKHEAKARYNHWVVSCL